MNDVKVPFLDVRASYDQLRSELNAVYSRVMESGSYILGEELESFEHEFADFSGTRHALGVGNGLDALTIALRSAGIGPGDEVIVPAHTFIATWLSVVACGAEVVPVDIDSERMLIDPHAASAACTQRTAAIVPVHLYGLPVEPEFFEELATRRQLAIIGDAAQAHGASVEGRQVGSFWTAASFSFYPSKNLGAFGDGGAITTNDDALAERARRMRNYGSSSKYEFDELGVNSRLDPLQAAFLRVKLPLLEQWNSRRSQIAKRYLLDLAGVPGIQLPANPEGRVVHSWQAFCIRHPQRDRLRAHLSSQGIETQIHYPTPPHRSEVFASYDFGDHQFPVTDEVCKQVLSLPIGPHMSEEYVECVIEALRGFDS